MVSNHIWSWSQNDIRAIITVVNNMFRFEIYDHKYYKPHQLGNLLLYGDRPSLSEAKQAVFLFLEKQS